MSAARIGVLVLAIVAAGLAALLARGLMSSDNEPQVTEVVEEPTAEVLVAVKNLDVGQRVASSDMRWQRWPEAAMNAAYITRTRKPAAIEEFTDSIARTAVLSGEPVTPDKLVTLSGAGFMSALIEPGMRAAAITITPETSAGGFILPNDRVDVVDVEKGQTILRNIRVLAIDQRFNEKAGEQVAVGRTATLELMPSQVELVSVAQSDRPLTLSLRSLGDRDLAGTEEQMKESSGSVVKIVRYGTTQSVRVK